MREVEGARVMLGKPGFKSLPAVPGCVAPFQSYTLAPGGDAPYLPGLWEG